jgi:hypothetical protein
VPCGPGAGPLQLAAGQHRVETASTAAEGFTIDRVVLHSDGWDQPAAASARPAAEVVRNDPTQRRVEIGACPDGCWFVLGEGLNSGWRAELDAQDLGAATSISGGMNGWWLAPSESPRVLTLQWTPQRVTDLGLLVTLVAVVGAIVLLAGGAVRRRVPPQPDDEPAPVFDRTPDRLVPRPRRTSVAIAAGVLATIFISPVYGLFAAGAVVVTIRLARAELLGVIATAVLGLVGAGYVARILITRPTPGFGWVSAFEWAHRPALFATILLGTAVSLSAGDGSARDQARPIP